MNLFLIYVFFINQVFFSEIEQVIFFSVLCLTAFFCKIDWLSETVCFFLMSVNINQSNLIDYSIQESDIRQQAIKMRDKKKQEAKMRDKKIRSKKQETREETWLSRSLLQVVQDFFKNSFTELIPRRSLFAPRPIKPLNVVVIFLQVRWIVNVRRAVGKEEIVKDHTGTDPVVDLAQCSDRAQIPL